MLKKLTILLCTALLAGCQTPAMRDPDSPFFVIPAGAVLELRQALDIPAGQAHVKFQHGRITGSFDDYTVGCRLNVKDLGPGVLQPGRFPVTSAAVDETWEMYPTLKAFHRILYLKSEQPPEVQSLRCRYLTGPREGRDISVPQVREALGDYFSLDIPAPDVPVSPR